MPEVGSIIAGKYRIVREIGAGGMGTVVAATHVQLGTRVALKFLNERLKDRSSSLERFTREARACAQLRSEHVCRVSDFGVEGDVPYIAMELLDGTDLAQLLDKGPLDFATAANYVLQACAGLAEAHALGIVHRDLKPHNLFLARRPDGSPLIKILDFGIAKIPVAGDNSLTRTAHVVGSPGYMAPEQLRSSKTVDARTDVWALGVILYELVSGRHPFYADAVTEVAVKIAMDQPPPLVEAPAGLQEVVMRCLAKEPDDRFADVAALASALAPFAPRGSDAALVVTRVLADSAETGRTMPQLPATLPESVEQTASATVRDSPRAREPRRDQESRGNARRGNESTHQAGAGAIESRPATQRRIAIGVGVLAVIGAIVIAFAVGRTSGEDEPQRDEAVVPPGPPVAIDAALMVDLEITITGVPSATIIVGGENWGDGTRIGRPVRLTGLPVQIEILVDGQPRHEEFIELSAADLPTSPDKPKRHTIAIRGGLQVAVNGSNTAQSEGTEVIKKYPLDVDAPKTELESVRRDAARAHSARVAKGLLLEDLGPAATVEAAIEAALKRKDLATAKLEIARLNAAVAAIQIDERFVIAKAQRVVDTISDHVLVASDGSELQTSADDIQRLVRAKDLEGANRAINRLAAVLAKRPRVAKGSGTLGSNAAPGSNVGSGSAGSSSAGSGAAGSGSTGSNGSDPKTPKPLGTGSDVKTPRSLPSGSDAKTPKPPPAGSQVATEADKERDQQKRIDAWMAIIRAPSSSPGAIVGACLQIASINRGKVPWDTCVLAQCKLDPNSVGAFVARAPRSLVFTRTCPEKDKFDPFAKPRP